MSSRPESAERRDPGLPRAGGTSLTGGLRVTDTGHRSVRRDSSLEQLSHRMTRAAARFFCVIPSEAKDLSRASARPRRHASRLQKREQETTTRTLLTHKLLTGPKGRIFSSLYKREVRNLREVSGSMCFLLPAQIVEALRATRVASRNANAANAIAMHTDETIGIVAPLAPGSAR